MSTIIKMVPIDIPFTMEIHCRSRGLRMFLMMGVSVLGRNVNVQYRRMNLAGCAPEIGQGRNGRDGRQRLRTDTALDVCNIVLEQPLGGAFDLIGRNLSTLLLHPLRFV